MIDLYDDQIEFINSIRSLWKGHKRILGMAPTGAGKTRIAARIIEGMTSRGLRVCFLVPRISLIAQTAKSFEELGLEGITYIWGDYDTDDRALITIASIDTYIRRDKRDFDLLIVDEAHIRRKILLEQMDEYPDDRYLGLTATPYYSWIGEYYTGLAKSKSMKWMIQNQRLSPYEIYAPTVPDLSKVTTRRGDYAEGELEEIMCGFDVVGDVVKNWLERGEDRLTMALCVNCSHANFLCVEFEKAGVKSEVITAQTPVEERQEVFRRMRDGITKVVTSVGTLTEGFDEPKVSCLINARPTRSKARYVQGMGRALRYLPGKTALIFDHSGTTIALGFPDDIDIDELPKGGGDTPESKDKDEEEKPEKLPKLCPACNYMKPAGAYVCPQCGFKPISGEDVETDDSRELSRLTGKAKKPTMDDKQDFYSELLYWKKERKLYGKNISLAYIAHTYKERFGVWPRGLNDTLKEITPTTLQFIKAKQKAFAQSKLK